MSPLRESEERFRVMADTAPVLVWRSGTDKACDFFNRPWLEFRGRTMDQEMGSGWTEGVHPADLDQCLMTYSLAFDERRSFRMEYRLRRADGEYRSVLDSGVPRFAPDGAFAGYIGSCFDITERKRAETDLRESEAALRKSYEQNRDLAGRLITAQELERARIARELHDDVGQRIASFSIAVGTVRRRFAGAPQPLHDEIQKAKDGGKMMLRPPQQGKVRVEFPDFIQPGDLFAIDVDGAGARMIAISVATYLEKKEDAVTLNVGFANLSDGTNFVNRTTLDVKAKEIRVVIENSGHRPLAR